MFTHGKTNFASAVSPHSHFERGIGRSSRDVVIAEESSVGVWERIRRPPCALSGERGAEGGERETHGHPIPSFTHYVMS